jgi:hypothetical protein
LVVNGRAQVQKQAVLEGGRAEPESGHGSRNAGTSTPGRARASMMTVDDRRVAAKKAAQNGIT